MPKYKPYTQRNFEKSIKGMGTALEPALAELRNIYAGHGVTMSTEDDRKLKDILVMAYEVGVAPLKLPSEKRNVVWFEKRFTFPVVGLAKLTGGKTAYVPPPSALVEEPNDLSI